MRSATPPRLRSSRRGGQGEPPPRWRRPAGPPPGACDEGAVEVGGEAVGSAAALAELETWRTGRTALALAATGGSLLERVRRVLGVSSDEAPRSFGGIATAAVLVVLFLVVVRVRYVPAAQSSSATPGLGVHHRFGPPDLNRLLGFELLPGPARFPTDDPREAVAWEVAV